MKAKIIFFIALLVSMMSWGQTTLPFSYDGGKSPLPTGVTQNGLGTDYGSSPKLKFDDAGDELIINFSDSPDKIGYTIKGNPSIGNSTTGTFDVLESTDGISYTSVKQYVNKDNSTKTESAITVNLFSRFIKFIYTTKTAGNIAIGAITITKLSCTTPAIPSGSISGTTPACSSTSLSFSGAAPGGVTYYWQASATGTSTANNAASALSVNTSGNYFVRAQDNTGGCWSTATSGFAATINAPVSIATHPANKTVSQPTAATFSVTASNASGYQWQVDTGSGFIDLTNTAPYSNVTTATLTINPTSTAQNGYKYKVIVKGNSPCADVTSNDATLTVKDYPDYYRSKATGNWKSNSTWESSDDNVTWIASSSYPQPKSLGVTILATHTVTLDDDITRDSGTTTTVNGTLNTGGKTYHNNGTTNINGTFQLENGGYADGSDFTYGSTGSLNFNVTHNPSNPNDYSVHSNHVYWPYTGSPYNVNILSGKIEIYATYRTVNGSFTVANGGFVYNGNSMLTFNGTATINSGGYFGSSPTYGSSSKLIYNSNTNPYNRGNEWTNANSGAGFPNEVQISNSTTLNPNPVSFSDPFSVAKNLMIDSGSALYMDYGGNRSGALSVGGNFVNNGSFSLGNAIGGDLYVAGNFTSGSGFLPKTQAVFLNGTATQTVSNAASFAYLFLNNTAGATLASNITVNNQVDFSNGKFSLGNYDFILAPSATITSSSNTKYFVTNGTGQLKMTINGGSTTFYPVGSASSYNPISIKNNSASDLIGINLASGSVTNAPDANYVVKDMWKISNASNTSNSFDINPQWNGTDEAANFNDAGLDLKAGYYNSAWTYSGTTISKSGSNPYTLNTPAQFTGLPKSTGAQYFAIMRETTTAASYFRTKASGNWADKATWEASTTGAAPWKTSTRYPNGSALGVSVQTGHAVVLNTAGIVITKTDVYGSVEVQGNNFSVDGVANAKELHIKNGGKFIVNGDGYADSGNAYGVVETGGTLVAQSFTSGGNFVNDYLDSYYGLFYFGDASVCDWQTTKTPGTTGYPSILLPENSTDMPIFRLSANISSMGNSTNDNIFNAVLETSGTKSLGLQGSKKITFAGGVKGSGDLTITTSNANGKFIFGVATGSVPSLGSTGNLNITVPTNFLQFENGANVPTTATVKLTTGTEDQTVTRNPGTITVDGILDITNLQFSNSAAGGFGINGILRTSHSKGLYGAGAALRSGNLTLNTNSTVEYYGANQDISNLSYYNLKFSGSGTKTPLGANTPVDTNGSVTITGTAIADYSSKNLASTGANTTAFTMDGGRLKLGTIGTQPNMMGLYNITGGVVEFNNSQTTAQTIRTTVDYKYQNIEVTGTNVGNSSGNIALKPNGTFTVKNGGIFTIRQNSIKCYDVTKGSTVAGTGCGVTVENNAIFRTGNGKGFSGTDSSFGVESSSIDNNITNISLANGSTIDYLGEKVAGQEITRQTGFVPGNPAANYSNLTISGDVVNKLTGNLVVDNILEAKSHTNGATSYTGKLIVEAVADLATANVITAKKGVKITAGDLIFENNAQLMQDAAAVNTGNITMNRIFTLSEDFTVGGQTIPGRLQYNFIISPVKDQKIKNIYPGGVVAPFVIAYKEGANWFVNAGDGAYVPGKGYAIKEPKKADFASASITTVLKGEPANGNTISYPLQYGSAPNHIPSQIGQDQGYNLVGNPYPSNLDIEELYTANKTKIESTFQFWDNRGNIYTTQQGSNYVGKNYALYNSVNGTGVGGGFKADDATGAERVPNQYAKVGTAFMIRAKSDANTKTLDFNNTMRNTSQGLPFFGKNSGKNPNEKDRYWLAIKTPSDFALTTAVVYFANGDNAFADDDSNSLDASDDIYTILEQHKLSIQGKASFEDTDVVPLGINTFKDGNYSISLHKTEGIFANGQSIYLKDKETGILTDLNSGDYSFQTSAGIIGNRFEIVYKPSGTLDTTNSIKSGLEVYRDGRDFVVRSKEIVDELEAFDTSGRLVIHSVPKSNFIRIDGNKLTNGAYILKIKQNSGLTTIKRILK